MKPAESFLPDFCSLYTTFVLVIASLLLALVLTLADFSHDYGFWPDLGLRALFIVWIALPSGAILCGLKASLRPTGPRLGGLVAFAVVQGVTALAAFAARDGFGHWHFGGPSSTPEYFLRILGVSSLVTAAWLRYQYVQSSWRFQMKAEGEARTDALQARMRPHFLFNSLNTLANLTRKDPLKAEELLLDLAELFHAIVKKEAKLVSLADEFGLTRQYLNLEQQRLGTRLAVAWSIGQAPGDASIPPLSLQPLVENAIRYGIEPAEDGGTVEISGRSGEKGLILTVRNTMADPTARQPGPGARESVANLRERLRACFPGQARLLTSQVDGWYQVRIVMPYLPRDHESSDR